MNQYIYEVIEQVAGFSFVKKTDLAGKEWWIPTDPGNSDYQAYLATLEAQETAN